MKAEEFDKKFDDGEEVLQYFDTSTARKPNLESKRVNIDFPVWMVQALDSEARHIGVSRQAIIKTWLADRMQGLKTSTTDDMGIKRLAPSFHSPIL